MTGQDNLNDLPIRCRPAHVAQFFGISIPTVYRWVGKGILPPPKKLAPGTVLWAREQILAAFDNAPDAVVLSGKKPKAS